ncbi:MAG: zinc ribbon domain-containing protein [Ruminiclostridium sp.]|nr:zinc ribbon domain-containing protein [Ruminiclostridium sp.]
MAFCTNCGAQIGDNDEFCALCGAKNETFSTGQDQVIDVTPVKVSAYPPPPAQMPQSLPGYQQPYNSTPQPQNQGGYQQSYNNMAPPPPPPQGQYGYNYNQPYIFDKNNIPPEYKPISAWGYFGYDLLFGIPVVGFVLLIVFAFASSNINLRNYARSFFCVLLLVVIVVVILVLLGVSLTGWFGSLFSGNSWR